VCDGYALMTGVRLAPPAAAPAPPPPKKRSRAKAAAPAPSPPVAPPARPAPAAPAPDPMDQFRVVHGGPRGAGPAAPGAAPGPDPGGEKKVCRREPFVPGMTNTFADDGTLAPEEIEDSRAFSRKKRPEPRRPPVPPVSVTCCKCARVYTVPAALAPRGADRGDRASYVCDGCIVRPNR
jgi:hypothetical protein